MFTCTWCDVLGRECPSHVHWQKQFFIKNKQFTKEQFNDLKSHLRLSTLIPINTQRVIFIIQTIMTNFLRMGKRSAPTVGNPRTIGDLHMAKNARTLDPIKTQPAIELSTLQLRGYNTEQRRSVER